jgi:6-phosphogluconolactonase
MNQQVNKPSEEMPEPIVDVADDAEELANRAADNVVRFVQEAIVTRGCATIALAGGSTPRPLYELLARPPHCTRLDFGSIHIFLGDERCVPPTDAASNFRLVRETLLERVEAPPENLHRIRGELPPAAAADNYQQELRATRLFDPDWPRFDLVLLGIGEDGHTASLFPDGPELAVDDRWVTPSQAPSPPRDRVTMTLGTINHARHVMFLVGGGAKADAVARVLDGDASLPAARVRPVAGDLRFMLDVQAASRR